MKNRNSRECICTLRAFKKNCLDSLKGGVGIGVVKSNERYGTVHVMQRYEARSLSADKKVGSGTLTWRNSALAVRIHARRERRNAQTTVRVELE